MIFATFSHCEKVISIAAVEEVNYRQSRLCRLLVNSVAFTEVSLLADNKQMSTGEIAKGSAAGPRRDPGSGLQTWVSPRRLVRLLFFSETIRKHLVRL
jgi:hypothetical protein